MLKIGMILLFAVFLAAAAPSPSNNSRQQNPDARGTTHYQPNHAPSIPVAKIIKAAPHRASAAKPQNETGGFLNWIGWFFSDTNRAIALGTFLLAAGAFAQYDISRRTAKRQLRAYVMVETVDIWDASGAGAWWAALQNKKDLPVVSPEWAYFAVAQLTIKNMGQTPARKVIHYCSVAVADVNGGDALKEPDVLDDAGAAMIGPGGTISKRIISLPFPMPEESIDEIRAQRKAIFVFGLLKYRDAFRRKRWTRYRLQYSGPWPPIPTGGLVFSRRGNDFK